VLDDVSVAGLYEVCLVAVFCLAAFVITHSAAFPRYAFFFTHVAAYVSRHPKLFISSGRPLHMAGRRLKPFCEPHPMDDKAMLWGLIGWGSDSDFML
jgi:hypothetical protein